MRFRYEKRVDVLDIRLIDDAVISRTEQLDPGTLVDLDQRGGVVAIEIIRPARSWPLERILELFDIDPDDAKVLRSIWKEGRTYPFAEPTEAGAASSAEQLVLTG